MVHNLLVYHIFYVMILPSTNEITFNETLNIYINLCLDLTTYYLKQILQSLSSFYPPPPPHEHTHVTGEQNY